MEQRFLLPLDLQYFAEENPDDKPEDTPPMDEKPNDKPEEETITLTKAEFAAKIQERLARDRKLREEEAERKRLEEQNEFKALYEQSQARLAEIEAQAKAAELLAKKQSLLLEAGYTADKLPDALAFITGDDEEAIKASVERFVKVAPPKPNPVDPAFNGGGRQQPEQKDGSELGKQMYEKIKHRLR